MVAYVQNTDGLQSVAANFTPNGVPGAGDTINKNGHQLTLDVPGPLGIDDGSAPVFDTVQFPAGAKAAATMVSPGITIQLAGRIDNSNGDLQIAPGARVQYTNSDDQIQDHGDFDSDGAASPGLIVGDGAVLEYIGTGGSMSLRVDGGGCFDIQGAIVDGFGSDTAPALDARIDSDPTQTFIAKDCWFVRSRNRLDLKFWGDETMGDIDIDVLGNINPQGSFGDAIRIDGSQDTLLRPSANKRIARGLRAEGDIQIRYMQDYASGYGMRCSGKPLTVDGAGDWADLRNWFVGNHGGSFMRAVGSLTNGWFRDVTDNPHAISLARLRSQFPVMSGNVFDLQGVQGSSDTGDCYATDASNPAVDFTTAGQEITLENDLVLRGPHTGGVDGPMYVTCNGQLAAGLHVMFQPKLRVRNVTGLFANAGGTFRFDEAGKTPADTIIEHVNNLWSNPDRQGPMTVARIAPAELLTAATDIISPAGSDSNVFDGYSDGLGIPLSTASDAGTLSTPPVFADATRNLASWARVCVPGSATESEAVVNFVRAGFPGYGTTPAVDADVYDVDKLRLWVRAGYVDREPTHAGRGITDTDSAIGVTGIDVVGGQTLQENEVHNLLMSVAATATSMIVMDGQGNRETVALGAKPGGDQESITLPAKGSLIFGDETTHHIVVNF